MGLRPFRCKQWQHAAGHRIWSSDYRIMGTEPHTFHPRKCLNNNIQGAQQRNAFSVYFVFIMLINKEIPNKHLSPVTMYVSLIWGRISYFLSHTRCLTPIEMWNRQVESPSGTAGGLCLRLLWRVILQIKSQEPVCQGHLCLINRWKAIEDDCRSHCGLKCRELQESAVLRATLWPTWVHVWRRAVQTSRMCLAA